MSNLSSGGDGGESPLLALSHPAAIVGGVIVGGASVVNPTAGVMLQHVNCVPSISSWLRPLTYAGVYRHPGHSEDGRQDADQHQCGFCKAGHYLQALDTGQPDLHSLAAPLVMRSALIQSSLGPGWRETPLYTIACIYIPVMNSGIDSARYTAK